MKKQTFKRNEDFSLSGVVEMGISSDSTLSKGFLFLYWEDTAGSTYPDKALTSFNVEVKELSAKWKAIEYSIDYDFNGGSDPGNPTSYYISSNTITLAPSQKDYYETKGWTDAAGTAVMLIPKGSVGNRSLSASFLLSGFIGAGMTMKFADAVVAQMKFDLDAGKSKVGVLYEKSPISYRYPIYNILSDPKSGIKEWKYETTSKYSFVQSSSSQVTWNAGWHVVIGEVTINGGVVCNGAVHLILTDRCKLTILNANTYNAGILVTESNSLDIYGQNYNNGKLITSGNRAAGIGGSSIINKSSGNNITINGGYIIADGDYGGAGIGGAYSGPEGIVLIGNGNNITINSGSVIANGDLGAGIGAAGSGSGSEIMVNGGTVVALVNYGEFDGIGGSSASNIYINTGLLLKAGNSSSTMIEILNEGQDLASVLAGKRYVTIIPK